jgi:hypothetical protein
MHWVLDVTFREDGRTQCWRPLPQFIDEYPELGSHNIVEPV